MLQQSKKKRKKIGKTWSQDSSPQNKRIKTILQQNITKPKFEFMKLPKQEQTIISNSIYFFWNA
jgi:hypothetical protein